MSTIHDVVTNPLFGVLTALIGFFCGHRVALWRDRRKEFNEVADILFRALLTEKKGMAGPSPLVAGPSIEDFHVFRRHLGWLRRRQFDIALRDYQKAKGPENHTRNVVGDVFYEDDLRVSYAINRLIEFTERE